MCMRGDLLIQVLNAAWHSDIWREREHTLWCTQRYCTDTCTCIAYGKLHMLDSNAHTQEVLCHIVSTGCILHYPANHSFGNAWEKFLLGVVPGFVAQLCSTVLSVYDLSCEVWLNQSSGNTHLKLAPHLGSRRIFCCKPITTTCCGL